LLIGWNVNDAGISERHTLPHEMDVEVDMLGLLMVHRILAHVDGGDVVAVRDRDTGNVDVEFAEQLPEPNALGHRVRHSSVSSFRARSRDRGLALRRPRDEGAAEVDAVP